MSDEPKVPESENEYRSLTGDIIISTGALLGPPAAVALDHFLSGRNDDPPTPQIELPSNVHPDD
jgi:hypothetical protein